MIIYLYDNKYLIKPIDIFKNYIQKHIWRIVLLLLSPGQRNKGLGKIVHKELIDYGKTKYVDTFRIRVVENNHRGLRSWKLIGYKKIESTTISMRNKESKLEILYLKIK